MRTKTSFAPVALATIAFLAVPASASVPEAPKGDAARVEIRVAPDPVTPGGEAQVTLQVVPASGIKINRYPRIKLVVPAQDGLVAAGEASVGNDAPPDPEHMEANYFKSVDPVRLTLKLDKAAPSGRHEIAGTVRYTYCVAASGFCAPVKAQVKIPVTVR